MTGSLADLIALSDERDQWLRRLLEAERAAYVAGYAAGHADAQRDADRAWAAIPPQMARIGLALAQLELLRWGPGGRERFGDPRASDYTPRPRLEAAS